MSTPNPERLYDRNFVLALTCQSCFVIANSLLAHYARWIEFLGGSLQQVGLVTGVTALAGMLLRPWMAQWINRVGARTMWAAGFVVFGLSSLANLPLFEYGASIFLVRSLSITGAALIVASGLTYVSQASPAYRRTEAIGIFGVGSFAGMLIGPMLGDVLLTHRDRESFVWLFVAAAIASLIPAIGLCFLRPTHKSGAAASLRLSDFVATARRYWPGMILLVDFSFGVCMAGPFVFLATYVDKARIEIPGVSVIGLFFWCYAGLGIAIRIFARRLPDRIGAERVLMAGALCMASGFASFVWVDHDHSWRIVVPALLVGAGHSLMFHTMTALTMKPFPISVQATGSALALIACDFGHMIGPPILGAIGERFSYAALFLTMGSVPLVVAVAYVVSQRGKSAAPITTADEDSRDVISDVRPDPAPPEVPLNSVRPVSSVR